MADGHDIDPMSKNKYLAAILNFLVWGLGYVYLGKKNLFSVLLIVGSLLSTIAGYLPLGEVILPFSFRAITESGFLLVDVAFAYDAYNLGKLENWRP